MLWWLASPLKWLTRVKVPSWHRVEYCGQCSHRETSHETTIHLKRGDTDRQLVFFLKENLGRGCCNLWCPHNTLLGQDVILDVLWRPRCLWCCDDEDKDDKHDVNEDVDDHHHDEDEETRRSWNSFRPQRCARWRSCRLRKHLINEKHEERWRRKATFWKSISQRRGVSWIRILRNPIVLI